MRIVIAGGSGLIGKKLVKLLLDRGHTAVPASPSTGVNCITGEGVAEVTRAADVLVDVTNSPSFEDSAVLNFYTTSTRNLLRAAADARVKHYVALSVVGAERLPDSGYMRAKVAQEVLIKAAAGVPYTIVRATQFFEFAGAIAGSGAGSDGTVHLPHAKFQPIAADDVAAALADVALAEPQNGTVEIAGPDAIPMDEFVRRFLDRTNDTRPVITDDGARYFGAMIDDRSLTPAGEHLRLGPTHFDGWMNNLARPS